MDGTVHMSVSRSENDKKRKKKCLSVISVARLFVKSRFPRFVSFPLSDYNAHEHQSGKQGAHMRESKSRKTIIRALGIKGFFFVSSFGCARARASDQAIGRSGAPIGGAAYREQIASPGF